MGGEPPQQRRLARARLAAQQDPGAVGEEGVDALGEGRGVGGGGSGSDPVLGLGLGLQAEIGGVQVPFGVVPASARPGRRSSYGGRRRRAPGRTPPRTAGHAGSCRGPARGAGRFRSAGRRGGRASPPGPGRAGRIRPMRPSRWSGTCRATPRSTSPMKTGPPESPDRAAGFVVRACGGRAVQIADQQVADPARHGQDRRRVLVRLQALVAAVALDAREAGDLAPGYRLAGVDHAEPYGRNGPHRLDGLEERHVQAVVDPGDRGTGALRAWPGGRRGRCRS